VAIFFSFARANSLPATAAAQVMSAAAAAAVKHSVGDDAETSSTKRVTRPVCAFHGEACGDAATVELRPYSLDDDPLDVAVCAHHRACVTCGIAVCARAFVKTEAGVLCVPCRRATARCEFAAAAKPSGCSGTLRELTARYSGHEPVGDRDYEHVWLCVAHRKCLECGERVNDHEFSLIEGADGVACDTPTDDGDYGCCFYCGACERMCLDSNRNRDWEDDGDAMERCLACSGECAVCGEQTDEGACDGDNFVCDGCADA
jgi:hypothetical protein